MDIQVNNLDEGYNQCKSLNDLVTSKGEALISSLSSNIGSLKAHWIGSDATEHINNLIIVHKALVALLTDAKAISSDAGNKIIAIQEVRKANGGSANVGTTLPSSAPNSTTIDEVPSTEQYFVDPAAANDLSTLTTICTDYDSFKDEYNRITADLTGNWTAGANREKAVSNFDEFQTNAETYKKYLDGAKTELGKAVDNIRQLS